MGCVRESGAPDSSRKGGQKRPAGCFRELEVASQQHKKLPKSQKYFISRAGAYIIDEKPLSPNVYMCIVLYFPFRRRTRNTCGRENYSPVRASAQKRTKKAETLWTLLRLEHFCVISKFRSCLQIPRSTSSSFV